jgi:hypothetical protein
MIIMNNLHFECVMFQLQETNSLNRTIVRSPPRGNRARSQKVWEREAGRRGIPTHHMFLGNSSSEASSLASSPEVTFVNKITRQ